LEAANLKRGVCEPASRTLDEHRNELESRDSQRTANSEAKTTEADPYARHDSTPGGVGRNIETSPLETGGAVALSRLPPPFTNTKGS
jgi:hypothetical protein